MSVYSRSVTEAIYDKFHRNPKTTAQIRINNRSLVTECTSKYLPEDKSSIPPTDILQEADSLNRTKIVSFSLTRGYK